MEKQPDRTASRPRPHHCPLVAPPRATVGDFHAASCHPGCRDGGSFLARSGVMRLQLRLWKFLQLLWEQLLEDHERLQFVHRVKLKFDNERYMLLPHHACGAIMIRVLAAAVAALLILSSDPSQASCTCECVNGNVQPLCSSSIDLNPICAPRVCPLRTPSVEPLPSLTPPPPGTSSCRDRQVYDDDAGRYVWRTVCR